MRCCPCVELGIPYAYVNRLFCLPIRKTTSFVALAAGIIKVLVPKPRWDVGNLTIWLVVTILMAWPFITFKEIFSSSSILRKRLINTGRNNSKNSDNAQIRRVALKWINCNCESVQWDNLISSFSEFRWIDDLILRFIKRECLVKHVASIMTTWWLSSTFFRTSLVHRSAYF